MSRNLIAQLLLVVGILVPSAGSGQPGGAERLQAVPALAPFLFDTEADEMLVVESGRSHRLDAIAPAQLGNREVLVEGGGRLPVRRAFDTAMAEHRRLSRELQAIPAPALTHRPRVSELVLELDDSFLLLRTIVFTVRDPDLARRGSAAFAELAQAEPAAATARAQDMPADLQADFQRFLDRELPRLPADDPLRLAYQHGGPDAVLRAGLAGQGRHEVSERILLPKRLQAPRRGGRMLSLADVAPAVSQRGSRGPLVRAPSGLRTLTPDTARPYTGANTYHLDAGVRTSGELSYDEAFLAGFSFGLESYWERKWSFGVGYFRVQAGAGYQAGLRIPLRLQGSFGPTRIESSLHNAPATPLTFSARVVPFDASSQQYGAMGVPADKVFGGHEFVLAAYARWGYKLRAFGRTWAQRAYGGPEFDASSHFVPPLGNSVEFATLAIPPALTQTELNLGVLKGYVQFGAALIGQGTAKSQVALIYDGQRPPEHRHALVAGNSNWHQLQLAVPAIPFHMDHYTTEHAYGFEIQAPSYALQVDVAARVRAGLAIDVDVWVGSLKKTLNTPWFELFRAPLPSVELGPHAGTKGQYVYLEGRRVHEMRKVAHPQPWRPDTVRPLRRGGN